MAAPVGHIFCALALLHSGTLKISDQNAFFAGTSFPDIRYISPLKRSATHQLKDNSLAYVKKAESDFELGRRLHVFVDHEREAYMREQGAYNFVEKGPYAPHILKMVEDNILFEKLSTKFSARRVFDRIYPEEREYGLSEQAIHTWHDIFKSYLDKSSWFTISRYYNSARAYQRAFGLHEKFFKDLWSSLKSIGFFLYAYFQIEILSRNTKLREIILGFYENKIPKLFSNLPN